MLHIHNHLYNVVNEVFAQWPFVLALMFLGLLAERHFLLTIGQSWGHRIRSIAIAVGVFAFGWNLISETTNLEGNTRFLAFVGTLMVVLQPIGVIALIARRDRPTRLRNGLAILGRLSLTNYLMQSVISTTLLFGYGFGLGPRFDPTTQTITCALIICAQMIFSGWWLASHDHGPVEGLVSRWTKAGRPSAELRAATPTGRKVPC
jgi:uncharacterized protein